MDADHPLNRVLVPRRSTLQRAIKQHLHHDIRFSFDTSTPFRLLASNQAIGFPKFTKEEMGVETIAAPSGKALIGKTLAWSLPSPIGDRLAMRDVIVPSSHRNTTQRDALGNHLLALHNLQALCYAIFNANRRFDAELITGRHTVAESVAKAARAIHEVMKRPSLRRLEEYAHCFNGVRKKYDPTAADDDRYFDDGYSYDKA